MTEQINTIDDVKNANLSKIKDMHKSIPVSASHGYSCKCIDCLVYFAILTGESEYLGGGFGPFGSAVLNEAKKQLGLPPIPDKYLTD